MMKNYLLFLFAMLLSLTVSAQKSPTDASFIKSTPTKVVELSSTTRGFTSTSRSNGGTELIYDERESLNQYDFIKINHDKSNIGKYKYRVELTSLSGDADLKLVGNNPVQQHSRTITESNNGSSEKDILEYIAWDLTYEEVAMEIIVIAYSNTTFRVRIYRTDEQLRPCDNQSAIEKIKETLCFCEINTLYHAEYFGRPILYVDQRCTELLDAGGISVYDCDGNQIAYTGFYTVNPVQEQYLDIKNKIYECSNQPQECDDESVIREIKADMCSDFCEEGKLYHATYYGDPVLYLIRTCSNWPDLPTGIVYNCHGQIIASQGFWSNDLNDNRLEVQSLIHSCEKQTGGGNNSGNDNCTDFMEYTPDKGIAEQSSDWVKYNNQSSDAQVKSIIYSEWRNGTHYTLMENMLEIQDDGKRQREDVVYLTGDIQSGKKMISWDMLVDADQTGYFNLEQYSRQFGNKLLHIFFENGIAKIYNSNRSRLLGSFDYPVGNFFKVELGVDLDRNQIIIYTDNGDLKLQYCCDIQLGGINFYAIDNASFLINNLCIEEVTSLPLVSRTNATSRSKTIELEVTTINNNPVKNTNTSLATFSVFPNPSRGMTTIQFEQDKGEDLNIEVFNQTGQLVKQLPVGTSSYINQAVDLSDLPNGMYLVKLRGATTNLQQKLLLQQ